VDRRKGDAGVTPLRELWDRGGVTLGGWCGLASPFAVEIIADVGYDWICLDTQHGLMGRSDLDAMLGVTNAARVPVFVRTGWNEPWQIMQVLDAGAQGVIVPMVDSAEEAAAAVDACRYPPAGHRSWGPTRAALRTPGYSADSSSDVVCAVMVETAEGLADVDRICRTPGLDAVFVGPSDLALSHGLSPKPDDWDERHEHLVRRVLEACTEAGVTPGIAAPDAIWARRWQEMGYRMLTAGSDGAFLREAAAAALTAVRGEARESGSTAVSTV
jgi:4-hydroxy-2-oxoheptanedioate aldolase